MNQTKKRLQIINIAISLTDIETIQLQMLKLASLRHDEKLKEILAGLQAQNYAQSQALITQYIETPTEEIVQRTLQDDQEIIKEFDLFVTEPEVTSAAKETELFDFDSLSDDSPQAAKEEMKPKNDQTIDFDNLLNLTADDIMQDNIDIDISHTPKDDFFDTPAEEGTVTKESHIDTDVIPKDDFFDTEETKPGEDAPVVIETYEDMLREIDTEEAEREPLPDKTPDIQENEVLHDIEVEKEETVQKPVSEEEPRAPLQPQKEVKHSGYKTIPYIDQKLKNMMTQYPPLIEGSAQYDSVNNWLLKISNEGYTEEEVEEVIGHIGQLREKNDLAQAAQLLLICGATESKYAQFMLARELFRGELLEKNLPEAFTLINRLAMDDDYPEAICDLAQLYEKGVGIGKDSKRAESLYKEAMEAGVKRAAAHYERLSKANKSLLGKFFGK